MHVSLKVCENRIQWVQQKLLFQYCQHLPTLQSKLKMEDGRIWTIGQAMCHGMYLFTVYTSKTSKKAKTQFNYPNLLKCNQKQEVV